MLIQLGEEIIFYKSVGDSLNIHFSWEQDKSSSISSSDVKLKQYNTWSKKACKQ